MSEDHLFQTFSIQYSVDIDGYVMVYSIDNQKSFEVVKVIYEKLVDLTGNPAVPLVLVSIQFILHTANCIPGLHNLRSFLEAKLTQNYFLIACMLSFL